jgi:hypothetical protein
MSEVTGLRVFALRESDSERVWSFGTGLMTRQPCPLLAGQLNPRIDLDSGGYVWGCESWWGQEGDYEQAVDSRRIELVPAIHQPERDHGRAPVD